MGDAQKERPGWSAPFGSGIVLWLLVVDWVFQWHHWFWPRLNYPLSDFARFGIAVGLAALGMVIALFRKQGWRYIGLLVTLVLAPVFLFVYVVLLGISSPVTVLPYPRRVVGKLLSVCRWTCTAITGKVTTFAAVVALSIVVPVSGHTAMGWIGVGVLSLVLLFFLGGFLHLATGPLVFVEAWHRFLRWLLPLVATVAKALGGGLAFWQGYDKTLPRSSLALETNWFKFLVYSSAYMEIKRDDLDQARSLWRYLSAFLVGLAATFLTTALAFSAILAVMFRFVPSAYTPASSFLARFTLSLSIITNLSVPPEFLSPPSWYTLVVFLEVASCFYLAAVTVLAFSIGARAGTEAMVESLRAMWAESVQSNKAEMERVDPGGDHDARIREAKTRTILKLR